MLISQASHCALLTVIELAIHHNTEGLSVSDISRRHYIPAKILLPVVKQLCSAEIVSIRADKNGDSLLILKKQAHDIFAFDIVQLFDGKIFSERHISKKTGQWVGQSYASRLIHFENKHYINYLQNRLKRINIRRWSEILEKRGYLFLQSSTNKKQFRQKDIFEKPTSSSSLIGCWQTTEEFSDGSDMVTSVEAIEFKADGTCIWSQSDDSGMLEPWIEYFSFKSSGNTLILSRPDTKNMILAHFHMENDMLILFYDEEDNKDKTNNAPIYTSPLITIDN